MGAHTPGEPLVAADLQEHRSVLRPAQVHHVAHAEMVDIAEEELGVAKLRDDLQSGVPQLVEDLLRVVLAGDLPAHSLPADLAKDAHQHVARKHHAHAPLAAAEVQLHIHQHHGFVQVQQGHQGWIHLSVVILKGDGHVVFPAAAHQGDDVPEQVLIQLKLQVGVGVAHGNFPLCLVFAAHHAVHHPQRR